MKGVAKRKPVTLDADITLPAVRDKGVTVVDRVALLCQDDPVTLGSPHICLALPARRGHHTHVRRRLYRQAGTRGIYHIAVRKRLLCLNLLAGTYYWIDRLTGKKLTQAAPIYIKGVPVVLRDPETRKGLEHEGSRCPGRYECPGDTTSTTYQDVTALPLIGVRRVDPVNRLAYPDQEELYVLDQQGILDAMDLYHGLSETTKALAARASWDDQYAPEVWDYDKRTRR